MNRRRLAWASALSALAGVLAVWAVGWATLHTTIRSMWWELLAARPLTEAQAQRVEACEAVGWWAWVRVLEHDVEHPCGESWGREQLSGVVGASGDRRAWLLRRIDAGYGPRARLRAALALDGGPEELGVDWLLFEPGVPDATRRDLLISPWADGRGPAVRAWAAAARLDGGADPDSDTLEGLELLASAGGAEAAAARSAAQAWVGIDDAGLAALAGDPPDGLPDGWAAAAEALRRCDEGCAAAWVAFAAQLAADDDGRDMPAAPRRRTTADAGWFEPLLDPAAAEAARSWLAGEATAVASAPGRVAYDLTRPGPRETSLLGMWWTGRATPWVAALTIAEVGRRAALPVQVRAGEAWLRVDVGERSTTLCGGPPTPTDPPSPPPVLRDVGPSELFARALRELRPGDAGARVAAARAAGWEDAASSSPPFPWVATGPEPTDPCPPRVP
jgi:hypothetical protein